MGFKHLLTILLAFSFFWIIGCSKTVIDDTESTDSGFPPSMAGLVILNGKEYEMVKGSYQWERKKGFETEIVITDHASPNQMAEQIESIFVDPNQIIDIKVEEDPAIQVYLWNEKDVVQEIEQTANQIIAPSSKGSYIYEVSAQWDNGNISYTFVAEVQ